MKNFVKKDQTLAVFIFILWSFGLIFAPYAKIAFASASNLVMGTYLLLHVLIFIYALYLSVQLAHSVRVKKLRPAQ